MDLFLPCHGFKDNYHLFRVGGQSMAQFFKMLIVLNILLPHFLQLCLFLLAQSPFHRSLLVAGDLEVELAQGLETHVQLASLMHVEHLHHDGFT